MGFLALLCLPSFLCFLVSSILVLKQGKGKEMKIVTFSLLQLGLPLAFSLIEGILFYHFCGIDGEEVLLIVLLSLIGVCMTLLKAKTMIDTFKGKMSYEKLLKGNFIMDLPCFVGLIVMLWRIL